MLVQKLNTNLLLNDEETIMYIKDITGNVGDDTYELDEITNTYTLTTNDTGYGDPNAERESMALFLAVKYNAVAGSSSVVVAEADPIEVEQFEVTLGSDGWYTAQLIKLDPVASPVIDDYDEGDVVYDTDESIIVQKTDDEWVEITAASLYDSDYVTATTEMFPTPATRKKLQELMATIRDLRFANINSSKDKELIRTVQLYTQNRIILAGAIYEFCKNIPNYYVAQRDIEFLATSNPTC